MLSSAITVVDVPAPGWDGLAMRPCTGLPAYRLRTAIAPQGAIARRNATGLPAATAVPVVVLAGAVSEHRPTVQFDTPLGVLSSRRPLS
jgi:hypothetical protein